MLFLLYKYNRISQLHNDELLEIFSYLSVRDCIRLETGVCVYVGTYVYYMVALKLLYFVEGKSGKILVVIIKLYFL